jgi:hypothetical protein
MIAKAIHLLHRWLGRDVSDGSDDPLDPTLPVDPTLDDETNDFLLAYSVPRAESEQAVLDACAKLVFGEHDDGEWTCHIGHHDVAKAEWARRKARADADEHRRRLTAAAAEVHARASAELRRLGSGR